jgi:nicotinate-nucleotide adenylyltransferase
MDVAFYGGSFDPPHVAHVLAAGYVLSTGAFARLLVVPVPAHALDKQLVAFEDRLRMCELALGWLPGVEVSPVEQSLPLPSRTLNTLKALKSAHPDWSLRLVIGADVLLETQKWHAFEQVAELAPPLVLGRVGVAHPGAPPPVLPDVSSTRVRELLVRRSEPGVAGELRRLVPRAVLEYIEARGLYVAAGGAR